MTLACEGSRYKLLSVCLSDPIPIILPCLVSQSVRHSSLSTLFKDVGIDTWISLSCYKDFSKLIYGFFKIDIWISLWYGLVKIDTQISLVATWISQNWYMDFPELLHRFFKLLHVFLTLGQTMVLWRLNKILKLFCLWQCLFCENTCANQQGPFPQKCLFKEVSCKAVCGILWDSKYCDFTSKIDFAIFPLFRIC